MVKGKRKSQLSKEKILQKITSYDIYRFYHGNFKVNELTVNRHRGEKNGSLIIGNKVGTDLTHKDFGDYSWRGDAFNFVEQIHKCDFVTAMEIIDRDFNLGLGGGKIIEGRKVVTWKQPDSEIKKPPKFNIVPLKGFTKEGLDYWDQYEQGVDDLKREEIYMPRQIWRNHSRLYLGNLLTFCFYYPEIESWKIYRPYAPKKEKNTPMHMWKWDTNVPFNYCENLKNMENCRSIGILAKSKKDRMVLTKALDIQCIANLQAEDPACVSEQTISVFKDIEKKYAIMDNDKKGKETSWWLTKEHGFKHVNVPDIYLESNPPCTDFADLCRYYGIGKVIEHFRNKSIINPIF